MLTMIRKGHEYKPFVVAHCLKRSLTTTKPCEKNGTFHQFIFGKDDCADPKPKSLEARAKINSGNQTLIDGMYLTFRDDQEGGGNHYLIVNFDSEITTREFQKLIKKEGKFPYKSRDIQIFCSGGDVTKPLLKDNKGFVNYVKVHHTFMIRIKDYFHQYTDGGVELKFRNNEEGGGDHYLTVNLDSDITTRDFQKLIKNAGKLNFKSRDIRIFNAAGEVKKPLLKENTGFVNYVKKHPYFSILIRKNPQADNPEIRS